MKDRERFVPERIIIEELLTNMQLGETVNITDHTFAPNSKLLKLVEKHEIKNKKKFLVKFLKPGQPGGIIERIE